MAQSKIRAKAYKIIVEAVNLGMDKKASSGQVGSREKMVLAQKRLVDKLTLYIASVQNENSQTIPE